MNSEVFSMEKKLQEYEAALRCIIQRFEDVDTGHGFQSGATAWAMYTDAKAALEGRFLRPA